MMGSGRSSGNEKIIHILEYICTIDAEFIVYWLEEMVDHCLKRGWRIGKSEVHDIRLEKSIFRFECCFVLVPFLDANIVVSPSDIEFRKDPGIFYLCD